MKLRPVKIKEKKSPALRVPDDLDMSLTASKHAHLTKPARLFILLSELYVTRKYRKPSTRKRRT